MPRPNNGAVGSATEDDRRWSDDSRNFSDSDDEEEDDNTEENWYGRLVISDRFQYVVAAVIVLNVWAIAYQADHPENEFIALNICFLAIFSFELLVRFLAFGICGFFYPFHLSKDPEKQTKADKVNEWYWNYFDFGIVFFGWLDLLAGLLIHSKGNPLAQVIRVVRIARILRILKMIKNLKQLRMLVNGLILSWKYVFWVLVLMLVTMLILAILCTTVVGHNADKWGEYVPYPECLPDPECVPYPECANTCDNAYIHMYFGTVGSSMQTLFQFLTMDDWGLITRMVCKVMPAMYPVLILYVVFGAMVIISLLTGVMAEHMNSIREQQEEEDQQEFHNQMMASLRIISKFFQEKDRQEVENGKKKEEDDSIQKESFLQMCDDEAFKETLQENDVDLDGINLHEIFECMDLQQNGTITWGEFKYGIHELRAGVTPQQVIHLRNQIAQSIETSKEIESEQSIQKSLSKKQLSVQDFKSKLTHILQTMDSANNHVADMKKAIDDCNSDEE
jgi:hypothetical protein